jgi:hypothetical protein
LSSVIVGVPAGVALTASPAITSGLQLDCRTDREGYNREHGLWHRKRNLDNPHHMQPVRLPERAATTNQTGEPRNSPLAAVPLGLRISGSLNTFRVGH